jgi:hypothetical protein
MAFDPQGFQLTDAIAQGQDIYEVQFPQWGVRTVAPAPSALNPNFQFPPPGQPGIPPTIAGIAIGPRSTVDRAWVSWNRQKAVSGPSGGVFVGQPTSRTRPISIQHPLMFAQPSGVGLVPTAQPYTPPATDPNNSPSYAMAQGLLYVWPKEPFNALDPTLPAPGGNSGAATAFTDPQATTIPPGQYYDQAGATRTFGALGGSVTLGGNYYQPYLELYLYLRPPLFAPPTARFPLLIGDVITLNSTGGAYEPIEFIPIFGRKNISVTLACQPACSFQLGLISCIQENVLGGTLMPLEASGGTAIMPGTGTSVVNFTNPCADYLVVYAKTTMATETEVQVAAYD